MRDPERTPEPFGVEAVESEERPQPGAPRLFVIQQHAARALHWDLRLEIEGTLVSWSVPRGPSLDPREKRLAVQTEDHPLEYADFEGVIPAGNYGAGAMIVWDRGIYHTVSASSPAQDLQAGKLDLILTGYKLQGRFALVRTKSDDGRGWLLLHKGPARGDEPEIVEAQPASVVSGLTVEELGAGVTRGPELSQAAAALGAPRRELRERELVPMLASQAEAPFSSPEYLFEPKYDGIRALVVRRGDQVTLLARKGTPITATYPELASALARLPANDFVLDAEIVALDASGRSSFERLQRRLAERDPRRVERLRREVPVVLCAFDLLAVEGYDVRGCALRARKQLLSRLVPRLGPVRFVDAVEEHGEALFELACAHDLEGVMAKLADSRYESGRRSRAWLKIKAPRSAWLAIVGVQPGKGTRKRLGSLLLAWQRDGALRYAGSVGSGLSETSIDALLAALEPLEVKQPSFELGETPLPRGSRLFEPRHAARVSYTEITDAGMLRHPVFLDWTENASAHVWTAPVTRVEPAPELPEVEAPLRITHRDKIFFPADGLTKGDLLDYYERIWPWLGPYLQDRPVVLTRYPDGIDGKSFFQKNAPDWTPSWARRATIDGTDYFLCDDLRTLLHVINSGSIPLHVWSARASTIEHPDWIVIDLDPKGAPFSQVVTIARRLHALLDTVGTPHSVKTSGQDGLHVLVPLGGVLDHDGAKSLAELIARVVCAELPDIATIARPIAARADKVYVDYLQNGRGKLIVAPFSVRPRAGAPVSTPLRWSQVNAKLNPAKLALSVVPERMQRDGDPMRALLEESADVSQLLEALVARLG